MPDTAYATNVEEVNGWKSSTGTIELRNNVAQDGDAAEGIQFIELNTDPTDRYPDASDIFKELSTVAGENYTIKVQYAGRPGYDATVNRFELLVDDVQQGNLGTMTKVQIRLTFMIGRKLSLPLRLVPMQPKLSCVR